MHITAGEGSLEEGMVFFSSQTGWEISFFLVSRKGGGS